MRGGLARPRSDDGFVGGVDGLVFGVLVFVLGTLIVVNAWQVVDAKFAAAAAAREAARTYVESGPDGGSAREAALRAAVEALVGHGRSPDRLEVSMDGSFARCRRVVFEARYRVPMVVIPVLGGWGDGLVVSARHAEVVDPYRSGLAGAAACDAG